MTYIRGNKTVAATAGVCLTTAALLFGEMISERKSKIRLAEKQYSKAVSALELRNEQVKNDIRNSFGEK